MSSRKFVAAVAFCLAVWVPSALAESNALKLDAVRSQQAEIRAGVESRTGIYKQLSADDRDVLLSQQVQLLGVIGDSQTVDELSEAQRIELFNALELIEALVNKADDERMVCEYRATIGSNRKQRDCKTVAQRREQREAIRNQIDSRGVDSLIQRN